MTDQYVKSLIRKLEKGSTSQIYNSLVEIRTKLLKLRNGTTCLLQHGGISPILRLLKQLENVDSPDKSRQKITDIALSILGNLCMDETARNHVQKNGGIYVFVRYFMESELEGVRNRCCRSLANLALSSSNCHIIHKTEVLPEIVESLEKTENKECQQTYCRAIRLLGRTEEQREKLVSLGAILPVSKLVSSEDSDLVPVALRTLSELSSSGCSFEFASQVLSAGAVKMLVSFVVEKKEQFREQTLLLLFHLSNHSNIRPAFGAAEGIQCFIDLINSSADEKHKFSMINVICMCCRESVNRVKLREYGALDIFLHALMDEKYRQIHSRIISGLQCFIYDEVSMNILLEKDVVPILIKHLQRTAQFTSVTWKPEDALMTTKEENEMDRESEMDLFKKYYLPQPMELLESQKNAKSSTETNDQISEDLECVEDDAQGNGLRKGHVFSIDSPTYEPKSDWNFMEYSSGAKCKQCFDPPDSYTSQSPKSSLSPLSTITYYSPSFSPSSSNLSSPGSPKEFSTVNNDAEYPLVFSTPYMCGSPEKGMSPGTDHFQETAEGEDLPEEYVYSEPEDVEMESENPEPGTEEIVNCKLPKLQMESKGCQEKVGNSTLHCRTADESVCGVRCVSGECQKDGAIPVVRQLYSKDALQKSPGPQAGDIDPGNPAIQGPSSTDESDIAQPAKRRKLDVEDMSTDETITSRHESKSSMKAKEKRRHGACVTENHILIILSRISQMYDPSKYMVTMETICALLDYLALVDQPEQRVTRLLSRIIRNPLCFEKLLQIQMPLLVYYKLLYNIDGVSFHSDIKTLLRSRDKFLRSKRCKFRTRFNSTSSTSSDISFLDLEDNIPADADSPTKHTDRLENQNLDSSDTAACCADASEETLRERRQSCEGSIVVKSGLTLLQDLCTQADSPFGRGVIMHWYARRDQDTKMMTTVCLMTIAWTRGMLQYYFLKKGILDDVLEILAHKKELQSFHMNFLLEAVCFLGHILEHYHSDDNTDLEALYQVHNSSPNASHVNLESIQGNQTNPDSKYLGCQVPSADNLDVSFIVSDGRVRGKREILVKSSALFAAMLEGYYSESNLSEISLCHTTKNATTYVVHYLHGCGTDCDVISDLWKCDINDRNLCNCLDILSLAHKYMLNDLQKFLLRVLCSRLITSGNACHVFQFSLMYDLGDLGTECIKCLFQTIGKPSSIVKSFESFLRGPNSEIFLEYLSDYFKNASC